MKKPTLEALQPLSALATKLEQKLQGEKEEEEYHPGEASYT